LDARARVEGKPDFLVVTRSGARLSVRLRSLLPRFLWGLPLGEVLVTSRAGGIHFFDSSEEYFYPSLRGGWSGPRDKDLGAWGTAKCRRSAYFCPVPGRGFKPNLISFQSQVTPHSLSFHCPVAVWDDRRFHSPDPPFPLIRPSGRACDLPSLAGTHLLPPRSPSEGDPVVVPSPLSPRTSQPNRSPPPSGRGTCHPCRDCCACLAQPCFSPLWLLQGCLPTKKDCSFETSRDHASGGSCILPLLPFYQMSVIFGEKWHGQLERAKVVLLVIFLFSTIINASNLLQLLTAKQK